MYENLNRAFTLRFKLASGPVTIEAIELGPYGPHGHQRLNIIVRQNGREVFPDGWLYVGIPAGHCTDSAYAKEAAASCVAMRPGDTDAEYFAEYTPDQLAWAQANGEELSMLVSDRYCDPETGEVRS
jgi:hypothetical protein